MKRILIAALLILTFTTVIFAQRGRPIGPLPGGTTQPGQAPDPTAALKAALNVSDAQIEAIKALMQTRQQRAQTIMTEIQQKRQAFNTLLDAASPNPTDVGNAAIALRGSEKKLAAERDWYISDLKKLLTADQQQTLDNLLAATANSRALGLLGLGGPGPGRGPRPQ